MFPILYVSLVLGSSHTRVLPTSVQFAIYHYISDGDSPKESMFQNYSKFTHKCEKELAIQNGLPYGPHKDYLVPIPNAKVDALYLNFQVQVLQANVQSYQHVVPNALSDAGMVVDIPGTRGQPKQDSSGWKEAIAKDTCMHTEQVGQRNQEARNGSNTGGSIGRHQEGICHKWQDTSISSRGNKYSYNQSHIQVSSSSSNNHNNNNSSNSNTSFNSFHVCFVCFCCDQQCKAHRSRITKQDVDISNKKQER